MLTWHVAGDPVQAIWREKQGCVRVSRNEVNTHEEFASTDAQRVPSGQGQHAAATCTSMRACTAAQTSLATLAHVKGQTSNTQLTPVHLHSRGSLRTYKVSAAGLQLRLFWTRELLQQI